MAVDALLRRPIAEIQNYESEVLPLLRLWGEYEQGFLQALEQLPGTFYAVANFNLKGVEPDWCHQRLKLFDMKIGRFLLGKNWCKHPSSERTKWIAVPEMTRYVHFNMLWDVPIEQQERIFLKLPISGGRSYLPANSVYR